jgi:hypothetical protein
MNGVSTKTLLNVELRIDDVDDSDEEIDSSLLTKSKPSKESKSSENISEESVSSKRPKLKLDHTNHTKMEESPTLDTSRFLEGDTRADTKDRSPSDSKRVNFADE